MPRIIEKFQILTIMLGIAMAASASAETRMLQQPDIHDNHLVFTYAGDIWIANRDGSNPRRLTSDPAVETAPSFSPDGTMVAFSANYHGNLDVYIVATAGGQPTRLTWHPGNDQVRGFSSDGNAVLFMSSRAVNSRRGEQLWTVSVDGGMPERLSMPQAFDGAYSPDGERIAYQVFRPAQSGGSGWKRHRGGTTPPIWIFDFSSQAVEKIPHDQVNDTEPMWVDDTIYFLSDRNDTVNLFAYDTNTRSVRQLTNHSNWDINNAGAGGDAIVYEAGGRLYVYDIGGGQASAVSIDLNFDAPQLRADWKDASKTIVGADLSPGGVRAVFAGRGDIFTVPTDKGDTRNLTRSNGVNDRDPIWSADGAQIAWLTDESGAFEIVISDQSGLGERRRIALEAGPYYYLSAWSPDGRYIAYQDNHLNLFVLDLESGESRRLGSHSYRISGGGFETAFSPDGRWLAFSETQDNYFRVLKLANLESGDVQQITEGMSEAASPAFSRDGQYLYFTAATNFGPRTVGLDMTTQERPIRRAIYAMVLASDGVTPLPLESDEEVTEEGDDGASDEGEEADGGTVTTRIDLDGLVKRIVPLPVAKRDYAGLAVAKDGTLFYLDQRQPGVTIEPPGAENQAIHALMAFDFKEREETTKQENVANFVMAAGGEKLLVQGPGQSWSVIATGKNGDGNGNGKLNLSGMKIRVDPRAEWRHIFDDVWRMEQEFFYAPNMHGLDWEAIRDKYAPLIDHVASREDLNTILIDMIGELEVGHNRMFGGDVHRPDSVSVGLLGADFEIADGRYRIAEIYDGENWNPFLEAPLAVPGLGISEGDFILAVNGVEVTADDNIFAFFENTVGQQTVLTVNATADMEGARDVTVKPVASESELRLWRWVETNRRKVAEATDGRAGYIYLPNTATAGYTYFNRYFFAQVDKEALVIDERYNGGGQAANYIVEVLSRPYLSSWKDRDGKLFTTPAGVMPGPKVMLINEYAGSGGDYLPWSFRHLGLGKLVGKRTWGGLIGIFANPPLIDGGILTVPYFRYIAPDGSWAIENEGVPPDIEVDQDPASVIAGGDPQLERAIAQILDELADYESPVVRQAPPLPTELGN